MSPMIIAAIILISVVIMFFSPKFSNAAVCVIGTIAMGLAGFLPVKTAFSYYTSSSIILMVGMMIVGGGMFHTGLAGWLGRKIIGLTGKGERNLQLVAIISGWIMSSVCSGSASMMILYPIFCSICLAADLSVNRILLPMFTGIGFGSFMTLAGSGMCTATASILIESGFRGWGFLEPAWFGLPKAILMTVVLFFFMHKLLPSNYVAPDAAEAAKADKLPQNLNGKMMVSCVILVATIAGMIIDSPVCPMYICAAIGGIASVVLGCLNEKQMFASISWSTVFLIGGMTAVAKGVEASGLGTALAEKIMSLAGNNASPMAIIIIIYLTTALITQFMSNNAAASLMAPIGIAIAKSMGIEPYAFVAAALFGSAIGCLTPMATPALGFIMEGGHYTPKDIFKWGLVECACSCVIAFIIIPLVWL